jgi:hypothetical protein
VPFKPYNILYDLVNGFLLPGRILAGAHKGVMVFEGLFF